MEKLLLTVVITVVFLAGYSPVVMAAEEGIRSSGGGNATFFLAVVIVAGFGMAIAAIGAAFAQSNALKSALEGIARNPGASGQILTTMLVGLAMIESLAIYVLVIALILLYANPLIKYVIAG